MTKSSNRTAQLFDNISKFTIYSLIFLIPIFFLPWTANFLDFNKQALLIVLSFLSLFAWMIKTLVVGEIRINFNLFHIAILVFLVIFVFSTIFSLWPFGSFWGWPQVTSESLLTMIGILLVYFLISNVFSRKEVFYSMALLLVSGIITMLFGALQILGKFIMPFDFAKITSFNTVGTLGNLGIFAAMLLPLAVAFLVVGKKFIRIVSIIAILLSIFLLVLLNSLIAWAVVAVGSVVIFVFGAPKRDFFDNRWLILPMFFIALSLFLGFFHFQIIQTPNRPIEVNLSQKASFDIAKSAVKERPIWGSGPGTFVFDFASYKDLDFNRGSFWNIKFDAGASRIITLLADLGVLGILSLLGLIVFFFFIGIKFLVRHAAKNQPKTDLSDDKFFWVIVLGMFASFTAASVGYFLAYGGLVMDFVYFLLIGGFIALISQNRKEIVLKPSSLATLAVTFAFTLVFIFGLGILILEGQRYAAEVYYFAGIQKLTQGSLDDAIANLSKAAGTNRGVDLYWRGLSQIYLQKLKETLVDQTLTKEEVNQRAQLLINNAVNASKIAVDINPKNAINLLSRAIVFQQLIGIVPGAKEWAIKTYDEAIILDPFNPQVFTQKGIAIVQEAATLDENKKQEKEALLYEAKTQFDRAVELKPDYAPAHFQIAMVYQRQGKIKEALAALEDAKKGAPFDVGLAFQIGLLHYQNKDYEKAKTELERAIGINPSYANALYFLGLVYDKQGAKEMAIEKFQKVLDLNPQNEEVRKIINNLKVGKGALEGISQPQNPTIPIQETPESPADFGK